MPFFGNLRYNALQNMSPFGTELLERFKQMRRKVRPAVEHLLGEARLAAAGKARFSTYEDVFGTEDE
jgi:hypothetical protein